ncbi:MAG: hypothetical protein JST00_13050 [Deltaproteobacteria bacterium]|nr:hypothetical protein [Deltaproteobacteria bacterium]
MKLRPLLFVIALAAAPACAAPTNPDPNTGTGEDDIVNVPQTEVERQSIGNCWLYAHASWAESMHKTATGEDFDVSQSYWTYWHWFDQITAGFSSQISTGGNYATASGIVRKYGLVSEAGFVDTDVQNEMSTRQASALAAINESLKNGVLKDSAARRDRALVRRELDAAWALAPEIVAKLNQVFGEGVSKTFSSTSSPADATGTDILRGQDFQVAYTTAPGAGVVRRNLVQAQTDWRQVYYRAGDRSFQIRVQKALHDAQPVIITWFVDFNAMENRTNALRGSFNMTTLNELGPGRQGGHMTVLEDYQAKLSDGRVLEAGKTLDPSNVDEKALLESALLPSSEVQFFRVKNSWGAARPDRAFAPGMPGYHDLYLDYLNGPVKKCVERDGTTDPTSCPTTTTPLQNVVLPPGY